MTGNNWPLFLDDQIKDYDSSKIKELARLLATKTVVVFTKPQNLTPDEQLEIASHIGSYESRPPNHVGKHRSDDILINDGVVRVTGALNENGMPGLFGHVHELDWHANKASNKARMPIVWMYGAEHMEGSRTSFINMIEAYNGMSDWLKEKIKDKKCFFGYKKGRYSTSPYFNEHINKDSLFDLVITNAAGQTGLYFPYNQVFGMADTSDEEFKELAYQIRYHILKDEYVYHHDWIDGQIVLSDQWLSLHKRWEFQRMDKRVLHRIALNYEKIYEKYP